MDSPDLSDELISRFENTSDLDLNNEIFPDDENMFGESEPDDIIILHMDIQEPLTYLRTLLEAKIGISLKKYSFWLQEAQILEPDKNLVDQCVKGEGLIQINVQIQTLNQRINIVDVLKPTEAALATLAVMSQLENNIKSLAKTGDSGEVMTSDEIGTDQAPATPSLNNNEPCLNWCMDGKFKKEQIRLKIPDDPMEWSIGQVKHWLQWAVRQFSLVNIKLSDWNITGKELCSMEHLEFRIKVPNDPGNIFWTHLELLKKCKFVAVNHVGDDESCSDTNSNSTLPRENRIMRKQGTAYSNIPRNYAPIGVHSNAGIAVGSGNNGQVQLWQFLLDILTDREYCDIISWVGSEGEFKLTEPDRVARLWGERKNKPAMNYEKLSRALRYYYDGDMISKVAGKRFAYKFDCDLKSLIGYNAQELSKLVREQSAPTTTAEDMAKFLTDFMETDQ